MANSSIGEATVSAHMKPSPSSVSFASDGSIDPVKKKHAKTKNSERNITVMMFAVSVGCKQSPDQPSLNDCLESTPPALNDLTSILLRFRLHRYAVSTDIEKAFLHVGLHEKDRDATRFLWLSDPSDPESPLRSYRFKTVLFGATCSTFILKATLLKHLDENKTNPASLTLREDLYVDNVLSRFSQQSELVNYFRNTRALMNRASMNLRSWTFNSKTLREIAARESVLDADEVTKVLGMRWTPEEDTMSFMHREIPTLHKLTKRDILRYSSQIYDPLGLLSPVTVRAKLLLQKLDKVHWDVPLTLDVQETWQQLAEDLNTVTNFSFPRQYCSSSSKMCLHVFVDASIRSYGAAAYIVSETEASLAMPKNRIAPVRKMTLPQLELMAAVIGARLATHLRKALNICDITLWSDSQIVLNWLSTSKPFNRFVKNRVQEIHLLTEDYTWKYCPTDDNPADLLTRGIPASQFTNNTLWNNGPSWIRRND
ncbi:uncharacterized protein LOC127848982 [Dreissena polymorpha]|uniref:uncharacterized protein LOC127848982 n=1 Tax=Dreissena polymorpha TaxID=45954 RepID=UPI0022641465|nr:uncharacterized protein LOC127848982 [Dreissena polymorpha]